MQNLIVLGIIPGTNIQITFTMWLDLAGSMVGVLVIGMLLRRRWHLRALAAMVKAVRYVMDYQYQVPA